MHRNNVYYQSYTNLTTGYANYESPCRDLHGNGIVGIPRNTSTRHLHGNGIAGIPRNTSTGDMHADGITGIPRKYCKDEGNVLGFPRERIKCCRTPTGTEKIVQDFYRNVAIFDFLWCS